MSEQIQSGPIYRLLMQPEYRGMEVGESVALYGRRSTTRIDPARLRGVRVHGEVFWSTLVLEGLDGRELELGGLTASAALRARKSIAAAMASEITSAIESYAGRLQGSDYARARDLAPLVERLSAPGREIIQLMKEVGLLSSQQEEHLEDARKWHPCESSPLALAHNARFIARELASARQLFETIERHPLTPRQREAIVLPEAATLVNAGAGSGKTSVIMAKVAHLVLHEGVHPHEILVLAFNREAAEEVRERLGRIGERLGHPEIGEVHARTFHAIGLEVLRSANPTSQSVAAASADQKKMVKLIEDCIETCSLQDPDFSSQLATWLALHGVPPPSSDSPWNGDAQQEDSNLARDTEFRSLSGDLVKSYEELQIANFLWLNSIDFTYEARFPIPAQVSARAPYHPDFHVVIEGDPAAEIWIEHFGVDREGRTHPAIDARKYREDMEWKREVHRVAGTHLIETFSWMRQENSLLDQLQAALEQAGVRLKPKLPEEIWDALRELDRVSAFSKELLSRFLPLARESGVLTQELAQRAEELTEPAARSRTVGFLSLYDRIHSEYARRLADADEIDFSDMIAGAERALREGQRPVRCRPKVILVDEFQDLSPGRARLLEALLHLHEDSRLFAVGDDWQAINGFAGGDVGLMTRFFERFAPGRLIALDRTFRYAQTVASKSGDFVMQDPELLRKTISGRANQPHDGFEAIDTRGHEPVEVIAEKLRAAPTEARTVRILARARWQFPRALAADLAGLRRDFPSLTFTSSTMHSAKGTEADLVFVLGVNDESVPSGKTDDPLLNLVRVQHQGISHAEERRVFYVAMTRARMKTYFLYDRSSASPSRFLDEMGLTTAKGQPCHRCQRGRLVSFRGGEGPWDLRCSSTAACDARARICPTCQRGIIKIDGPPPWSCSCGATLDLCPKCRSGFLMQKNGKHGPFRGCSRYHDTPRCDHTEQVRRPRRR